LADVVSKLKHRLEGLPFGAQSIFRKSGNMRVSVAAAHSYEQRGLARDAFREEPLPSGAKVDPNNLRHGLHYSRTDMLTRLCTHGNKTVSMPFGLLRRTVKIWATHQNLQQNATLVIDSCFPGHGILWNAQERSKAIRSRYGGAHGV
jgi:hypothetical protein